MRIGMGIPETGPQATRAALEAWARRAEALGFSHLAVSDHIVIPSTITSPYPYSETGEVSGWGESVEQLTYLAYLAARFAEVVVGSGATRDLERQTNLDGKFATMGP